MGLDMHSKQKICNEIFRRYQKADKKGKGRLLDEYAQTLGYNRDYLAHLLTNRGKKRYAVIGGKPVKFVAKDAPQVVQTFMEAKKGVGGHSTMAASPQCYATSGSSSNGDAGNSFPPCSA